MIQGSLYHQTLSGISDESHMGTKSPCHPGEHSIIEENVTYPFLVAVWRMFLALFSNKGRPPSGPAGSTHMWVGSRRV